MWSRRASLRTAGLASIFASNLAAKLTHAQETPRLDVIKRPLESGVSADDAAGSMTLRAQRLNITLVAHMPLSQQVAAMTGKPQRLIAIYQFCDPLIAQLMVDANPDFAAYLPCRVTLVEDAANALWLVMTNLDPLVAAAPQHLRAQADKVRSTMLSILDAGTKGDL